MNNLENKVDILHKKKKRNRGHYNIVIPSYMILLGLLTMGYTSCKAGKLEREFQTKIEQTQNLEVKREYKARIEHVKDFKLSGYLSGGLISLFGVGVFFGRPLILNRLEQKTKNIKTNED